jgi:hypothetical protein
LFKDLWVVRGAGLAAILEPVRAARWYEIHSRLDAVRQLAEDHKRLEALMRVGPLLPAVENAALENAFEVDDLIAASAEFLRETLAEFGALAQFQIQIAWKPEEMLKAEVNGPRLREIVAGAGPDRAARGAAVAGFMNGLRGELAETFRQKLAAAARDVIELPRGGETDVVNLVALIDPAQEPELDRAVEAIDAAYPGALNIRYTGPLPPISFAGIEVKKTGAGEIRAARRLLGLDEAASSAPTREAFLARVRALHPDVATDPAAEGAPDISEIKDAYTLLTRIGEGKTSSGRAPPLVAIRREGQLARRA